MSIQTTICNKCHAAFTCEGGIQRAYIRATMFVKCGSHFRPVCSDKEACEGRVERGELDAQFTWDESTKRRRRTTKKNNERNTHQQEEETNNDLLFKL